MVPRRKNIDLLVTALQVENPKWSLQRCEVVAKENWDHLYRQQVQIAQVRANNLMMQFLLVSTDKGGIDVVRNHAKCIPENQEVYLVVNPKKLNKVQHA